MYSSAVLRDHDSHRDFRITFTFFQSLCLIVDHIDDSPPVFLTTLPNPSGCNKVTIPTSIHSVTVQSRALYPSIHVSCMDPESTANSLAVARFTSVTAARARGAREMYSVSIVSLGAELGRPSIRLMFNSSHNITERFPTRCFVIKSAGLTVPRIFSILSSWFFLFLLQPKELRFHMLDCAAPASESQHLSRFALELRAQALVSYWPIRWLHLHSVPCCGILAPRCSVTPLLCGRPGCQGVLTNAHASSRCRAPRLRATSSVSIGESIDQHDALFLLQRELPHGTWRVE